MKVRSKRGTKLLISSKNLLGFKLFIDFTRKSKFTISILNSFFSNIFWFWTEKKIFFRLKWENQSEPNFGCKLQFSAEEPPVHVEIWAVIGKRMCERLCVCLCSSEYFYVCLCLSVYVCVCSISVCACVCVRVSIFMCVWLSVYVYVCSVSVCACVSESVFVWVFLCVSVFVCV